MCNFKKALSIILLVVIMVSILSACNAKNDSQINDIGKQTVVDMNGNQVEFNKNPSSIYCYSSMFEQIILSLKAEKLLKASSYSRKDDERNAWFQTLYPQIMDIEESGGDKNGITNELLVAYDLDLMFVATQEQYEEFTSLGIPCVVLDIQDIDGLIKGIEIVGLCLGEPYNDRAKTIIDYSNEILNRVENKTKSISETDMRSTYFMESRYAASEPTLYMTWGSASFQSACLKRAGIKSISDELFAGGTRAEITVEQLLACNPETIVIGGFYEDVNYDALMADATLSNLSAIKNNEIYKIPIGASEWSRIGMESLVLPLWYGKTLYPDIYADIDINTVIKEFYSEVMNIKLTDDQLKDILSGVGAPTV